MLKGIPALLPPELLKILAEMGHGDEIVIADANFPAASVAQRLVRCDGAPACPLLEAVLTLLPLDQYTQCAAVLMDVVEGDDAVPVIWDDYQAIIARQEETNVEWMERFAFYERARQAYAVVITGETAQYANIILKKGVIAPGKGLPE
ncbi:MAG: L-fucose mutarotase [Eubacteriales bacterium]|nr:L-fucose mutarotase [Eubacteriales bacterium]